MLNLVRDAFTFPFRGGGKYILLIGGVLGLIAEIVSYAPLVGFLAAIFLLGYMLSIYFQIIQSSATGSQEAPEFPETSNIMEDLISPIFQVMVVAFLSFLPLIIYLLSSAERAEGVLMMLTVFGIIYFPMALLAVVILGQIAAASPHIVLPGIFRAGLLYWVAVASLVVLYIAEYQFMSFFSGKMIIGAVIASFVGMYTLMVNGRILGIIYREKAEELEWL